MGIILPFEEFILVLIDGLPQKYRHYHDIASLQPICEMLLPDWLVNWPEKAPSLSTVPPTPHSSSESSEGDKNVCSTPFVTMRCRKRFLGVLTVTRSTSCLWSKLQMDFFFFFDDGHEICVSKIPWNVATQECFC